MKIALTLDTAIGAALAAVNGKATQHALTTALALRHIAEEAENILADRGVPKSLRSGCVARYVPAAPGAKSYRYGVTTTAVALLRGSSAWYLVGVTRCVKWPREPKQLWITITPAVQSAVIVHALRGMIAARNHDAKAEEATA